MSELIQSLLALGLSEQDAKTAEQEALRPEKVAREVLVSWSKDDMLESRLQLILYGIESYTFWAVKQRHKRLDDGLSDTEIREKIDSLTDHLANAVQIAKALATSPSSKLIYGELPAGIEQPPLSLSELAYAIGQRSAVSLGFLKVLRWPFVNDPRRGRPANSGFRDFCLGAASGFYHKNLFLEDELAHHPLLPHSAGSRLVRFVCDLHMTLYSEDANTTLERVRSTIRGIRKMQGALKE